MARSCIALLAVCAWRAAADCTLTGIWTQAAGEVTQLVQAEEGVVTGHASYGALSGVLSGSTLTAVFTQLTPPLASLADDATVVQQETDYAIMTLTEMLLLLKARDYGPLKGTFERFQRQLDELRSEER